MELEDLPWWKDSLYYQLELFHRPSIKFRGSALRNLRGDQFKREFHSYPLSCGLIKSLIKDYAILKEMDTSFPLGVCFPPHANGKLEYVLKVNKNQSLEEKGITFIHESVHAIYRTTGLYSPMEDLIEDISKDFYGKNSGFVDRIYLDNLV